MTKVYSTTKDKLGQVSEFKKASPFVMLIFVWGVSWLALMTPIAEDFQAKLLILLPPVFFSMLLLLAKPQEGFAFWSIALGLFVTQTGFQWDVGSIRISALEIIIVVLLLIYVWFHRNGAVFSRINLHLPGWSFLLAFIIYSLAMFLLGLIRGDSLNLAVEEFKGFILYPLTAIIILVGINRRSLLRLSVMILIVWYIGVAAFGIYQFIQGERATQELVRVSGDYAAINMYGITLMAVSLLTIGVSIHNKNGGFRILGLGIALWLFLGAIASVARTVWIAYAVGLLFLLFFGKGKPRYIFLILAVFILLLFFVPGLFQGRILQLTDSSTVKRMFYLESGFQAWKASPIIGWGWGKAFWYYGTLIPSGDIPWYHNDYLNLAVQTGLIGLVLYLGYWIRSISFTFQWLKSHPSTDLVGYIGGTQAALVALLVAALFEHVLWRPDMAGLVGLISGLMLAAVFISKSEEPAEFNGA